MPIVPPAVFAAVVALGAALVALIPIVTVLAPIAREWIDEHVRDL
jgi:hypothetical protein